MYCTLAVYQSQPVDIEAKTSFSSLLQSSASCSNPENIKFIFFEENSGDGIPTR